MTIQQWLVDYLRTVGAVTGHSYKGPTRFDTL
jgi:hypothetical protein